MWTLLETPDQWSGPTARDFYNSDREGIKDDGVFMNLAVNHFGT